MNVESFYFGRNPQEDLRGFLLTLSRFINDSDEFGEMFVACIALAHAFKELIKMLLSS